MAVILFSGGADSVALAYEYRDQRPILLFVNFGQPARAQERKAAQACAMFLKLELIEHSTILPGVGAMFGGGPRVMPGRNLALLSLAVGLAASKGRTLVMFGAIAADQPDYPDCRQEFVQAVSAAAEVGYGVHIRAPFSHLSKAEVMARTPADLLAMAWSCYEGGHAPCGRCNSCLSRAAR
jgi:7-cyano-7-deazaguanine synthase